MTDVRSVFKVSEGLGIRCKKLESFVMGNLSKNMCETLIDTDGNLDLKIKKGKKFV
jgi:hypothetical protein